MLMDGVNKEMSPSPGPVPGPVPVPVQILDWARELCSKFKPSYMKGYY